jgi:predicted nucleic acid-binding protein
VKVIPDSSFFICFVDDLEGYLPVADRIQVLATITGKFEFLVVPAVEQESHLQRLPAQIQDNLDLVKIPASGIQKDPSIELLRPLLGKGEHEVISCAQIHLQKGDIRFVFILDDGVARNLVKRILPALVNHMKGTVGFLGYCAIQKVLDKNGTIQLLTLIGKSKFRVDQATISTVITEVHKRCV